MAWARSLVVALRRNDAAVAETVSEVITPITEDNSGALQTMQEYAAQVADFINDANTLAQGYYAAYEAAAAAGQAALAQTYLTQAVNAAARSVTIGDGSVVAAANNTLAAFLAGSAATITTIEEAVANGDEAITSRIDTVTAQSGGNATSIQQITQAGPGEAKYALLANSNGHITAGFLLNSGVADSNIVFIADKFIIANPSDSGDLKSFFVAGNVNGTPTVGIAGDLVIDGSILARHLDVGTLSAISADIGNVTAGVLQSADGKFVIDLDAGTIDIET